MQVCTQPAEVCIVGQRKAATSILAESIKEDSLGILCSGLQLLFMIKIEAASLSETQCSPLSISLMQFLEFQGKWGLLGHMGTHT